MFLPLVTLLITLCALGIPLLLREFPVVLGSIHASGASERWSVKLLLPLLAAAGFMAPFSWKSRNGTPFGRPFPPTICLRP